MCSNARGSASKQWVRQIVLVILYLSLLILISVPIASCITLEQLYPFNVSADGDLRTEQKDDGGSPPITLDIQFPFFDRQYHELYVNNNGIISFIEKLQTYKPENFNKLVNKVPLIAPYWADIDIENVNIGNFNESVVYRITYNDSAILDRASREINDNFISASNFSAELVIIVTWYNVGFYGASGDTSGKSLRNTFQAVLVTDRVQSYAIFNYQKIVWTTGSNSGGETETGLGGDPAVVGFHSGRNESVYNIDVSGSDDVLTVSQTSNVNRPGVWIYRIDGPTINDLGCKTSSSIDVSPRKISMLGRQRLHIKGPCLSKYFAPKARFLIEGFPPIEFSCAYSSEVNATCVTPSVFRTGEIILEFDPDGKGYERYRTTISSTHLSDLNPDLVREKPDKWLVGKMVTASWEPDSMPEGIAPFLEVLGYTAVDGHGNFTLFQTLEVEATEGSRKFKLIEPDSSYSTLITRLCWHINDLRSTLPLCIWSDVFPVRWQSENSKDSQDWCEKWIERERTLSPIVVKAPNCPCILTIAENDLGHFHVDPYCDKLKSSSGINCVYNKNAQQCMRRNIKSATNGFSGETCCYDNKGELMDIRAEPGAGTHQRYHNRAQGGSVVPFFSYFESDLLPKLHCCLFSQTNCSDFWTLRNPTTCSGYKPPSPGTNCSTAQAAGDPHLVTLDGKDYSFNGRGDFILVQDINSSVVIQVRAEQTTDKDGSLQQATVFTSVAVSAGSSSDVVELRKHRNESGADVLVNGEIVTIDTTTSQFRNISLQKNSTNEGSYLIVLEPVSVSVTIEVTPDLLNIIALIGEESLKGRLEGLLGNYNGIADDDFIARDGTVLPSSASERQLHEFGMTWAVTEEEQLLSPLTEQDTDDSSYEPVFIDEILVDSLPPETMEICGTNKQCQFDYHVTRKESVAKSTAAFTNKFEALKEELEKKVIRCPFLNPPENGNRTVPSYSNGSIATFTCNQGYEMILGSSERYCQDDSTWSGSEVVCAMKTVKEESSYTVYIIAGSSVAGFALIVIVVCSVILVYRHMKKRKPPEEVPHGIEEIEMVESENIPVFTNPVFLETLHSLTKDGRFRIPRPDFVDPSIFQEYF